LCFSSFLATAPQSSGYLQGGISILYTYFSCILATADTGFSPRSLHRSTTAKSSYCGEL